MNSLMMSPGSLTHRATLDGSTEGITCIEFDPTVSKAAEGEAELTWTVAALITRLSDRNGLLRSSVISGFEDPRGVLR